jgi:hypothetical protein
MSDSKYAIICAGYVDNICRDHRTRERRATRPTRASSALRELCPYRVPMAFAPLMGLGRFKQSARTRCGCKGAALQHPSLADSVSG